MNKMAFKAFFISSLSQTHTDRCRASDASNLGRKDFFDIFFSHHTVVGYNIVLLRKAFSCLRNLKYIRRATWWWRRGLVSLQITKIQDD